MSFLRNNAVAFACLTALAALPSALAHGHIQKITIGSTDYPGMNPSNTNDYGWSTGASPVLKTDNSDQGYADFTKPVVATGGLSPLGADATVAKGNGGDQVTMHWNTWPDSHKGSVTEFMALCPSGCAGVAGADLDWFKISEANYDPATGKWPTEGIATGLTWSFKLPSDISSGQYLVRHELLGMHTTNQPQFYPTAFALDLESSGTVNPSPTGKFPAMYATNNMATTFGIYGNENDKFVVPGIPVYGSGGAAPAPAPAPSASKSAAVSSSVAAVPTSSAAVASSSVPAASSSVAVPIPSSSSAAEQPSTPTQSSAPQVPSPAPETPAPSPQPETPAPAPVGGNLQSFAGAVEGISAPAVTG